MEDDLHREPAENDALKQPAAASEDVEAGDATRDDLSPSSDGAGTLLADSARIPPATGGNIILSIVGAAGGAAIGAGIWFVVEYFANYQVGVIAMLVGLLAGLGAVKLGGRRDKLVGLIAAIAGVAGIVGGSYASYKLDLHSDHVRAELRQQFDEMVGQQPESAALTEAQKDELFEVSYRMMLRETSYIDVYKDNPSDVLFIVFFGVIGLWYGYRVGSSAGAT